MGDFRAAVRQRLRDSIVDAARAQTIATGWDGVRMGSVATMAGVSRQTVYNEFTNKAGLAEALALREVERFSAQVRAALYAPGGDLRAAAYSAISHTLAEAAVNPLVRAILTNARGGSEGLLPYLTTRSELVLTEATTVLLDWAAPALPGADPVRLAFAADSIVRLVVSHIVLPQGPPEQIAASLAELAIHLFGSAVAHGTGPLPATVRPR